MQYFSLRLQFHIQVKKLLPNRSTPTGTIDRVQENQLPKQFHLGNMKFDLLKALIYLLNIIRYLILSPTIQICVLAFALFLYCLSRATVLMAKRLQQQFHSYAWHFEFNFQNVLNKTSRPTYKKKRHENICEKVVTTCELNVGERWGRGEMYSMGHCQ